MRKIGTTGWTGVVTAASVLLVATPILGQGTPPSPAPRSVPSEFVREIALPGASGSLLRPTALFADRHAGEVLIGEQGHNRVLIFDEQGTYRGEFQGRAQFTSPQDLVVDRSGFIYVLAGTREGRRVLRYDFDGQFLGVLPLDPPLAERRVEPAALAIDANGRVYVRDLAEPQVCVYEDAVLTRVIPLAAELAEAERRELGIGAMVTEDDTLYIAMSSLGTVHVYDPSGKFVRAIGQPGTTPGELAFPVAVALSSEGLVLVLDQNRFNVVCYDRGGEFLGEFGGKGISPGWFYRPSLLAIDSGDQVYVGQIFMNRLQVCRIPDFIAQANRNAGNLGRREDGDSLGNGVQPGSGETAPRVLRAHEYESMESPTLGIGG